MASKEFVPTTDVRPLLSFHLSLSLSLLSFGILTGCGH